MSLRNTVLDRLDEESLHELSVKYPSLLIDEEWKKRLSSCDRNVYIPVLNIIKKYNIEKTKSILDGLETLRYCFPWRIGVVYDYMTGAIKNEEIHIGDFPGRYKYKKPLSFTWLESDKNKLMLREITSYNSESSRKNISYPSDPELSHLISNILLENDRVKLDYAIISADNKSIKTYDNPLPNYERYEIFPYKVNEVPLVEPVSNYMIYTDINIPVKYSPDVQTYLEILNR